MIFSRLAVVFVSFLVVAGVALRPTTLRAQTSPTGPTEGIRVSIPDTSTVLVEAGGVASRMIKMENTSSQVVDSRLVVELPAGWTVLIPPPRRTLNPGQSVLQLISIQIPASTLAGVFNAAVFAEGYSSEKTTAQIRVAERVQVESTWTQTQEFVRAGATVEGRLSVVNRGNSAISLEVRARSSLNYRISIRPNTFALGPGESKEVGIEALTLEDVSGKLTHSLVAEVHRASPSATPGLDEGLDTSTGEEVEAGVIQTATYIATILPVKRALNADKTGMIPAYLTLFGGIKKGRATGQVTLDVPEVLVGKRRYTALLRAPDASNASEFADTDQFSLRIRSAKTDVKLGDHTFRLTDLLESGSQGMGGQVEYVTPRVTFGGYGRNSRTVFPGQRLAAGYVHYRAANTLTLEVNGMHKDTFEKGNAFSVAAELTPGETEIRTEIAAGLFDTATGREWGRAIDLSGRTAYKNSRASLSYEEADAQFLGAIQHGRAGSGSVILALRPWLRLDGQAYTQQRFYDLAGGQTAKQTNTTGKTGITATRTGVTRSFVSLTYINQTNDNTLSTRRRKDEAVELKVGINRRALGLSGTLVSGQTKDEFRPNLDRYISSVATLYATQGAFSVNVFGSYLNGPTFYNPVSQNRFMFGGSVGWDSGVGTQAYINLFKSVDLEFDQQEFMLGDARVVHRFSFGHDVTLRARIVQTTESKSVQVGAVGFSYRIPFFFPDPAAKKKNANLSGVVIDSETGKPLSDIILTLDGYTVSTDADGTFQFRGPSGTEGYLSIDRLSAGLENRPVQEFPLRIEPDLSERQPLRIELVRAAKIQVQLRLDEASVDRNTALSGKVGPEAMASMVVEARRGSTRIRRMGGREGEATFSDLIPGKWDVFIVGQSIPEGYKSVPDTLRVVVEPGGTQRKVVDIKPRSRGIQMIDTGAAKVGVVSLGAKTAVQPSPSPSTEQAAPPVGTPALEQEPGPAEGPAKQAPNHFVAANETLASLARQYYHSTRHWVRIWNANKDLIGNPDQIVPGMSLVIPTVGALSLEEMALLRTYADR